MSEQDPYRLPDEELQLFNQLVADFAPQELLTENERRYQDTVDSFHNGLSNIYQNRSRQGCRDTLTAIDDSAQMFRILIRDTIQDHADKDERSDIVVSMLERFQTDCVGNINSLADTQFDPEVPSPERHSTKSWIASQDNGGNLSICEAADSIHQRIARKYTELLAKEVGVDGMLRQEKLKYQLTKRVSGLGSRKKVVD